MRLVVGIEVGCQLVADVRAGDKRTGSGGTADAGTTRRQTEGFSGACSGGYRKSSRREGSVACVWRKTWGEALEG